MTIKLPKGYKPSSKEKFMNENQLEYFRLKLEDLKEEILKRTNKNLEVVKNSTVEQSAPSDEGDKANNEISRQMNLKMADKQRKLLKRVEAALSRIEKGTYGYCIKTGEQIPIERLDAKPDATMTVEAQTESDKNTDRKI